MQARLAFFWRSISSKDKDDVEHDILIAEQKHEKFCSEFLTTLPSAFSLQTNKQYDERLPMLPLQRAIFHISIFDSICHNFRPVLLKNSSQVQFLPSYKQVLLSTQQKALAVAALNILERVSILHTMMGGSQIRFAGIIIPTFEAAVLLGYLCMHQDFPGENENHRPNTIMGDVLGAGIASLKREECIQAVQDSLSRLQMLAEVSTMAEVGAYTLDHLVSKMLSVGTQKNEDAPMSTNDLHFPEYSDSPSLAGVDSLLALDDIDVNWAALTPGLSGNPL